MTPIHVGAIGLWAPGHASARAWLEGRLDAGEARPSCAMLRTRTGRYASPVARMALAALEQIGEQTRIDLSRTPTVFGSAYGEIRIAFEQLDMIEREGVPSPARFKNSVHNAASGHFSIGSGNGRFSTAIAAGRTTFAMCLVEAWAWLEVHGGSLLLALSDESLPAHLSPVAGRYDPLGLAFQLGSEPPGSGTLGCLSDLRRRTEVPPVRGIADRFVANPCSAALPLVAALLEGTDGVVAVGSGEDGWSVEVRAGGGQRP